MLFVIRPILIFLLVMIALVAGAAGCAADDLATYLERHGLTDLLALHLEERLDSASPEERQEIAIRLAEIYAVLLERTEDMTERVDLEERSRELIALVPDEQADELRLALLRGSYVVAERIAENHRLRQSDAESIARAQTILSEALPNFATLVDRLKTRVETLERRRSRSDPAENSRLTQELDLAQDLYQRCLFLNAWALYYQSWLRGRPESARLAGDLFAQILDPQSTRFSIRDVSLDLLETEAYARTVLGMALCSALTEPIERALQWLGVLENSQTIEKIRKQVPAWRMAILLEQGEFDQARSILEAHRSHAAGSESVADDRTPLGWIRLAAVHALEAADTNAAAARLAGEAIAEMAAQGELNQVLDLAERYGVDSLGTTGFTALYVHGATLYQNARELHGGDEPTEQPEIASRYAQAADMFSRAVGEADASRFPDAAAGARLLIGWCEYFQSRYLDARAAFVSASERLTAKEAEEALWMAILSLDRALKLDPTPDLGSELEGMIAAFISRFPASEYTPKLILRQSDVGVSEPSIELVEELLRIPNNSADYAAAQRKAAQMLFELYRDAEDETQRADYGNRYLSVALPLWSREIVEDVVQNETTIQVFVVRGRRILDVALSPAIERLAAARDVLNRFEELHRDGTIDLTDVADELDYRRMQVAMAAGAMDQARLYADRIWEHDESSDWARAAARTMLRISVTRWRAAKDDDDVRDLLDRVIEYGKRVISEFEDDDDALSDQGVVAYYATVAQASHAVWQQSADQEEGTFALLLYKKLLDAYPDNRGFLRAVGLLAHGFADYDLAIECWQRLSAGTEQSDERWYEARYYLIAAILKLDPPRALRVFDQHKTLNPELGPGEWSARFSELERSINAALAAGNASDTGGDER